MTLHYLQTLFHTTYLLNPPFVFSSSSSTLISLLKVEKELQITFICWLFSIICLQKKIKSEKNLVKLGRKISTFSWKTCSPLFNRSHKFTFYGVVFRHLVVLHFCFRILLSQQASSFTWFQISGGTKWEQCFNLACWKWKTCYTQHTEHTTEHSFYCILHTCHCKCVLHYAYCTLPPHCSKAS